MFSKEKRYKRKVTKLFTNIRREVAWLTYLTGADILFVCEDPEGEPGASTVYLTGEPMPGEDTYTIARRILNELKVVLDRHDIKFNYTMKRR